MVTLQQKQWINYGGNHRILFFVGIAGLIILLLGRSASHMTPGKSHQPDCQKTLVAAGNKKKIPDFLLTDAKGNRINTAAQKGKVLFINFWATSCVPCLEEMRSINLLYNRFVNDCDFLLLSIDADDDFANSTGYISSHGYNIPLYHTAGVVPPAYFRGVLPTTVLIDKNGNIAAYYEGGRDYSTRDFENRVDSLLRQPN